MAENASSSNHVQVTKAKSFTRPSSKSKRVKPLTELVRTEKEYVKLLGGIIRKVASAWSRSKLPPKELDSMFRAVEAVYRANRSYYKKLKAIGPNPSSPAVVGEAIMQWIEDLEVPYTRYYKCLKTGFDAWKPVRSNKHLLPILQQFSSSNPPLDGACWTLDSLFDLPHLRLRYYKKLYTRLLKKVSPAATDHKALVDANEKLDVLLEAVQQSSTVRVGESPP